MKGIPNMNGNYVSWGIAAASVLGFAFFHMAVLPAAGVAWLAGHHFGRATV